MPHKFAHGSPPKRVVESSVSNEKPNADVSRYDYANDKFLNGNKTFDKFFDGMVSMYQTYVTSDKSMRDEIDAHFDKTVEQASTYQYGKYQGLGGLQGYLHSVGERLGIRNFDQQIAEFHPNASDSKYGGWAMRRQGEVYAQVHNAYENQSDAIKEKLCESVKAHGSVIKSFEDDKSTQKYYDNYGLDVPVEDLASRRQQRVEQAESLIAGFTPGVAREDVLHL